MRKAYLGLDIGSISTKGVVIDQDQNVIAGAYHWTQGNPIDAAKGLIADLREKMKDEPYRVVATGTTGSARKLIGVMTGAVMIKNEITAHAVGTIMLYPDVRTIFEIGGQDSKIILIENGVVVDYAMNTLCAAGTGSFLSSQAGRLGVQVEDFGGLALLSKKPTPIAARCTVFAESDLVHKAQMGHKKEDIVAGLCKAVVTNYLNNVAKGKRIVSPIVFQGGVSKNRGVIRAFEQATGHSIAVDPNSHLIGALGAAILAQKSKQELEFCFDMADMTFETRGIECTKCSNRCEVMCIYRQDELIDAWGNKCERGQVSVL